MRIPETATKGVALLSEMMVIWVFLFSDIRGNHIQVLLVESKLNWNWLFSKHVLMKVGIPTRSEELPRHQEFLLTGMFPNHIH